MEHAPPPVVMAVARAYRRLLEERFGPRLLDVRLFGSQARGDSDEDSDVDVAVIVRGLSDAERAQGIDLAYAAWRGVPDAPLLSPLLWSDVQLEDRLRGERRIALDVMGEGIPL